MNKIKLMTIVGTRPEVIKLSSIIKKADVYFDQILVHTGQNYDDTLNGVFFRELGIRQPDVYLDVPDINLGHMMGNVISKSYDLMEKESPDAVLVLGDTNSCLSVISAKRLKIPVFHMEAGNRCKDENLPEEVIRRIVDVTSDVNMCYSENARRYILDSGVHPEYTFVVGSPIAEVLSEYDEKIEKSDILDRLNLESGKYILLSAHREENIDIDDNFFSLMNAVNVLAEKYNFPILYSCHPRSEKKIAEKNFKFDKRVVKHKPLGLFEYNALQKNAYCVVSDSGTLPEEAAYYHFPAVSVRTSTERPEAMEQGAFTVGSITSDSIIQAVNMAVKLHKNRSDDSYSEVSCYQDLNVSDKVVNIIQSYTNVVNKMIWRKNR
ncbi:MAG: UDP-N-acetylglucosamine 2-epimerase (non-hydrolyzing) [Lachnospiraceae bacterium]|nr:UDP-N-acetylglucosamine 2-epimerase (non-hydrolyzing) [Lachnospiraceae bacterium]